MFNEMKICYPYKNEGMQNTYNRPRPMPVTCMLQSCLTQLHFEMQGFIISTPVCPLTGCCMPVTGLSITIAYTHMVVAGCTIMIKHVHTIPKVCV